MADNTYNVEIKPASHNGYFTPGESNNYYSTRYARDGVTVHWWGDGTGADNHDNIVNYMTSQASQGIKSVNYILSDNKITLSVPPDDVAWCSGPGNPTTISVETQPTLGDEGYKKWGWLLDQLEQRYSKSLALHKHSDWMTTDCPGTIDLSRIRAEADKWKSGAYNPQPVTLPAPTPQTTPNLQIIDIPNKTVTLIRDANLWDLRFTSWSQVKVVKGYKAGAQIEVSAVAHHPLGGDYYLTEYSFTKGISNGFNVQDCIDVAPVVPPAPVLPPTPIPEPAPTPTTPAPPAITPPIPLPVPAPVVTASASPNQSLWQEIFTLLRRLLHV